MVDAPTWPYVFKGRLDKIRRKKWVFMNYFAKPTPHRMTGSTVIPHKVRYKVRSPADYYSSIALF